MNVRPSGVPLFQAGQQDWLTLAYCLCCLGCGAAPGGAWVWRRADGDVWPQGSPAASVCWLSRGLSLPGCFRAFFSGTDKCQCGAVSAGW